VGVRHVRHPAHPFVRVPKVVDLTVGPEFHVLSGWGESHHGWARVKRPRDADEVAATLRSASAEGRRLCLRGAGRSYGDAAVHSRGDVLDLTALDRVREFDPRRGTAVVEAGVTIDTLWRTALPHGWWPAVVPGTMRPTVGGCVAMNVHGKNQFKVGGFGEHVEELEIALPSGERRRLTSVEDAELFRAVVGGFGMLGVVTAARLRLKRVHSGLLDVTAVPIASLPAMIEEFERRAPTSDYLVGWVDCFDEAGRGVLHAAKHLGPDVDPTPKATLAVAAQELPPRILGVVPREVVPSVLSLLAGPTGMSSLNRSKYLAAKLRGVHSFRQPHVQFAFLLDYVPGWKRIYAPGGLIQYQSFVPRDAAARVHGELLALCRTRGMTPWLGVYKKHRACPVLMSHAVDGYSFAMDFPVTAANRDALWKLCAEMDEIVLAAGGRFYLAKDLTASPAALERAYPGLARFREIKRELDPNGVLTSDLAVRLGV
jgi:FAD/FMN-containing dehydrogenase